MCTVVQRIVSLKVTGSESVLKIAAEEASERTGWKLLRSSYGWKEGGFLKVVDQAPFPWRLWRGAPRGHTGE